MTSDPVERPDRLPIPAAPGACATPPPGPQAEPSPAFRRLLESLEQLARQKPAPQPLQDTGALGQAIARADDDFRQVMDLRRRLEEAFRSRQ